MSTQVGDEVLIMSQEFQPMRSGEIRGVSDDPEGVVYLVWWPDTDQESHVRQGRMW